MDPLLERARDVVTGRPRFYPPGQHPATAEWRETEKRLLALPSSAERDVALEHVQDTLARFEEGESRAKALYYFGHRR